MDIICKELGKHLAARLAKQAEPRPEMIEAILGMTGDEKITLASAYGVPDDYATSYTKVLFFT